jgi:hypothetical protein
MPLTATASSARRAFEAGMVVHQALAEPDAHVA